MYCNTVWLIFEQINKEKSGGFPKTIVLVVGIAVVVVLLLLLLLAYRKKKTPNTEGNFA